MLSSRPRYLLTLALAAALAGCSAAGSEEGEADHATPETSAAEEAPESSAFPVTIEHAFGETVIEAEPERVVALGRTEADVLLALGVVPVGYVGLAFLESGLGPWSEELLGEEQPVRLEAEPEVDLEAVAALEPDLIVTINSVVDEEIHRNLEHIAPTVARPAGTAPWQVERAEETEHIAAALGRAEDGRALNDEVEELLAQVREEHPQFQGRTAVAILPYNDVIGAYTPGDTRGQFLASLGFELPQGIRDADDGSSAFIDVSPENVDVLDGDLLLVMADDADFDVTADIASLGRLQVAQSEAILATDREQRAAITINTVLSLPYALEHLVPRIAEVIHN
ncbi:ABC transporter substrate-binding protein [Bogoriella caseilytica]|uniref:Iron complex transport system substrate-binding protein n=1 Tax=Bogoriella caseilytica TaxID=56055 RepID=A0A3N2BDT7_9MICO|nr:ABC transporter substrate-binding protein [Bogoriella caseilytica]ROR73423.1 iron complex transport system substrate-binding protein [Bogoriella caseilytica]